MPIDAPGPQPDPLIDQLVADLRPVRRRNWRTEAMILAGVGVLQLVAFFLVYGVRPDFMLAMHAPAFWWKVIGMAAMTLFALATLLRALDPARGARRGLGRIAAVAAIVLAAGWLIDSATGGGPALNDRLAWHEGLHCLSMIILLSLPAVIGVTWLMRRGAPTDPGGTALAAGVTAAAWGAFVFAFSCPYDDPLFVVCWYTAAVAIIAVPMRLMLPRLTRW